MGWHQVLKSERPTPNSGVELVVAGRMVALFCDGNHDYFAIDGICPHQGGPLGKGKLENCVLTCPWHGWQFDIRDGQSRLSPHVRQPIFPTRMDDHDELWIELPDE